MLKSPWRNVQARRRNFELAHGGISFPTWIFDYTAAQAAMVENMSVRTGMAGPFEGGIIVQGSGPNVQGLFGDLLSYPAGDQISRNFYENLDTTQGSFECWWIPEFDSGAGGQAVSYFWFNFNDTQAYYDYNGERFRVTFGDETVTVNQAVTAGTLYHVVFSWDFKNTIDGMNYVRVSVNDSHTYGNSTGESSQEAPRDTIYIGSYNLLADRSASAILAGFTIYRRVLTDGTYGQMWKDPDEINTMYAAGVGADPCLITGSWDIVFCLPTDSTAQALNGAETGHAWSHPHSSNQLEHGWLEDGGYLGDEWGVAFNATSTIINCGSGATLDDVPAGAVITMEGWFRIDSSGEGGVTCFFGKSDPFVPDSDGWSLYLYAGFLYAIFNCGTTDARRYGIWDTSLQDGKWHHLALVYDDTGARVPGIAIDGSWTKWLASGSGTSQAGVGVYQTDAARDFIIGNFSGANGTLDGVVGWQRLSNIARYTIGTDFVPPRTMPAADGNTVEQWAMNDGSGVTVTASVTSPGNDGTITSGTWERQWDQFGSPVVPYSVEGAISPETSINCGSGATIDNLPNGDFTAECWVRADGEYNFHGLFYKTGWQLRITNSGSVYARVDGATIGSVNAGSDYDDGKWHHIAFTFDGGTTDTILVYVDGIYINSNSSFVAPYVGDAANDLILMNDNTGDPLVGCMAWGRLSNSIRYTANFVPPSRLNPPAPDANTMAQYNFRDGAGTTLTDSSGNANHGTISNGTWNITPDMEIDAPGDRVYPWGYTIGVDAVDEGVVQKFTGLSAGENYVLRPAIRYERDHRAQPYIEIYDDTNGASITKFDLPWLTGTHDGGNNSATLSDSTAPQWPISLIGATVHNITDGSSGTITAIAGNTVITAALAGGTDNDWDNGDTYRIFPLDIWMFADLFTFELPTVARNGVAADCTAISVRVANDNSEGVFYFLQAELLENLVDNPSLETGAGNPWIPDGWANSGLDPGDTQSSTSGSAIVRSGSEAIQYNIGAVSGEAIFTQFPAQTIGRFLSMGTWCYGSNVGLYIGTNGIGAGGPIHSDPASYLAYGDDPTTPYWYLIPGVWRVLNTGIELALYGRGTGTAPRFYDDAYAFECDPVTITCTPASPANSVETISGRTGLQIGGRDSAPVPITGITATAGSIRFYVNFRHDGPDARLFGISGNPQIASARHAASNQYINAAFTALDTIQLAIRVGGVITTNTFTPSGIMNNTWYLFEYRYIPTQVELLIDGISQVTVVPVAGIDFGVNIPDTFYPGDFVTNGLIIDAVFG